MLAIITTRDTFKDSEVAKLAEQAAECVSLVATNILSLKHWYYLKDCAELPWYSPKWLKTKALSFALSYVQITQKSEKFLN